MPAILRDRVALVILIAAMLIPVSTSSLGGLTHVLTCEGTVKTPFAVVIDPQEDDATVISATTIERGETPTEKEPGSGRLCGGLSVDLEARTLEPQKVEMVVPITNHTEHPWKGTVLLELGDTPIPVDVGEIPPGETRRDSVVMRLPAGDTEISGSLLIGP